MSFKDKLSRIQRWLLALLLVLLPYHTMASYVIGDKIPGFKFWKELFVGIIFLLFVAGIIYDYVKFKIIYKPGFFEKIVFIFVILELAYILISDDIYRAFYIGRIYFMPILLVPAIKNMNISKTYIKRLLLVVMANTIILCIWGIIQSQLLGDDFLMNLGYPYTRKWGPKRLNDEFYLARLGDFQRIASTFAAPNTFGLYLAIIFNVVLLLYRRLEIKKLFVYGTIGVIAVTLIMTFSRTAWIGCIAGLIIYCFKFVKWSKKNVFITIKTAVVIFGIVMLFDGIFFTFDTSTAIIHLVVNTVNGNDSSVNGHINSLYESAEKIIDNPFGLGMGNNGQRAKVFIKKPNLTESSYFLMAFEVGIIGCIIYYLGYIAALYDSIKTYIKTRKNETLMPAVVVIIMMLAYISLPYIQDFELLVYVYVLMSFQYNKKYNQSR